VNSDDPEQFLRSLKLPRPDEPSAEVVFAEGFIGACVQGLKVLACLIPVGVLLVVAIVVCSPDPLRPEALVGIFWFTGIAATWSFGLLALRAVLVLLLRT